MRRMSAIVACIGVSIGGAGCRSRTPDPGWTEQKLASRPRLVDLENKEQLAAFYDFDKKVLYLADQARFEGLLKDQPPGGLKVHELRDGTARVGGQWDGQQWDDVARVAVLSFPDLQDLYFEVGDYRLWLHGQLEHSKAAVRGGCVNYHPVSWETREVDWSRISGSSRTHTRRHTYLQDDGPFVKWERLWQIEIYVDFGRVAYCEGPFRVRNQTERWLTGIDAWVGPY